MSKRGSKRKEVLPGYEDEEVYSEDERRGKKSVFDKVDAPSINTYALSNPDSEDEEVEDKHVTRKSADYWKVREKQQMEQIDKVSKSWGKSREMYYNSDTAHYFGNESDDERAQAEETEVQRLQRLQAQELESADFGLEDIVTTTSKSGKKKSKSTAAKAAIAAVSDELLDEGAMGSLLTDDEKIKRVIEDSPELLSLLDEFTEKMRELKTEIAPLLKRVQNLDPSLASTDGISFLQLKHQLLLRYCIHVAFYLLLKAEGKSVANHPVIKRLVAIRLMLERIRPVDKQLRYQIEKLLKAGAMGDSRFPENDRVEITGLPKGMDHATAAKQLDLLSFKPNLTSLAQGGMDDDDIEGILDLDRQDKKGRKKSKARSKSAGSDDDDDVEDDEDAGEFGEFDDVDENGEIVSGRQRLMGAASFDVSERKMSRSDRESKKLRAKASTSKMVQEFYDELSERPEESSATGRDNLPVMSKEDRERLAYEEANYVRLLDNSKSSRKRSNERLGAYSEFDDFADTGALAELELRQKQEEQKNREILTQMRKRTRLEDAAAGGQYNADDDDDFGEMDSDMSEIDDDITMDDREYFKSEVLRGKKARVARQEAKRVKNEPKRYSAPIDDSVDLGAKRFAGKTIVQNRGLTRSRNSETKTPRTKLRDKHEKALKKRRAVVKEFKGKTQTYTGEATGIKRGVISSTKIKH